MLAPICLFTYNRLNETIQTIEALKRNLLASNSNLYIFSDGPKDESAFFKIEEVRNYLKTVSGFKTIHIIESDANQGLANSILRGVTQIFKEFDKIIVLEDDLICAPSFLEYMNQFLDYYQDEEKIGSINGYSPLVLEAKNTIYFQIRPFPWGWGTWKNRWNSATFNKEILIQKISNSKSILKEYKKKCGNDIAKMLLDSLRNKNDSWYVRWTFYHFENEKYSVFPVQSYIQNIGHTIDGTHCKGINSYRSIFIGDNQTSISPEKFEQPPSEITKSFLKYFTLRHKILIRIKLLSTNKGRREVYEDLKLKITGK